MQAVNKVTIADLHMECGMIDTSFFDKRLSAYKNDAFTNRDMWLQTVACDEVEEPPGEIIEQVKSATIVRTSEHQLCRYVRDQQTGKLATAFYYNRDYSEVRIHLWKGRNHPIFSLTDWEYIFTGAAFSNRLTQLGGAVLHGSSLAFEHQGIVFSANSGIGKSTHANLWKERFGEDVVIVNDDKPAIRFYEGIPYIFGTPWSGKTDLNMNVRVPLKAVVFIRRSERNRIERLNARDSIFELTAQIERPYYDSGLGLKTLERIENLVATVPVYRLHCNKSQEAVEVVYDEIIAKRGFKYETGKRF
ncbi:hypothetical protein SK3146_05107 [Paenibacillus konkukensis]|uniref:Aldolase n=1 Tax=Paenibacillus konkukensis TaxID=2020716 RepID=A0ABY4RUC4_9BACL|nr:hypothetical protein [Paenibacillus konkukensis]UQZ85818.1 hypothetical protein SK3146_05107 [Paenibacillus konkukensis]